MKSVEFAFHSSEHLPHLSVDTVALDKRQKNYHLVITVRSNAKTTEISNQWFALADSVIVVMAHQHWPAFSVKSVIKGQAFTVGQTLT